MQAGFLDTQLWHERRPEFSCLAIEILVFIDRRSVTTNALHPLTVKTSNVARETLFLVKEVLEDCLLVRFVVEAQGSTGFSLNRKRPSHTDIIVLHVLIHHIKDLFETEGNELCLGLWYISRFRPSFLLWLLRRRRRLIFLHFSWKLHGMSNNACRNLQHATNPFSNGVFHRI
jgi:hypothetical protein